MLIIKFESDDTYDLRIISPISSFGIGMPSKSILSLSDNRDMNLFSSTSTSNKFFVSNTGISTLSLALNETVFFFIVR